jgi:hypothetical protein
MIRIKVFLTCDRCGETLDRNFIRGRVCRKDLDALRVSASRQGWRQFRPGPTAPMADFCKLCVVELTAERLERKPVKGAIS